MSVAHFEDQRGEMIAAIRVIAEHLIVEMHRFFIECTIEEQRRRARFSVCFGPGQFPADAAFLT